MSKQTRRSFSNAMARASSSSFKASALWLTVCLMKLQNSDLENKSMDPREELRDLIAQAREHLRYYNELGLTHIGEITSPATITTNQPPQFTTEPTKTMPTKKENELKPSLFGESSLFVETASPAIETNYANETL